METVKDTPYTSDIERTHALHEAEFLDAQLTEQDTPWLAALRGIAVDETWLAEMNEIVAVGSIDLRTDTDPATTAKVMYAREQFCGVYLGWDEPDHPLHESYQAFAKRCIRTMPLATVIKTQRVLSAASIDVAKVVNTFPATLSYAPESVREKMSNLEYLGLNVAKVVNASPATLGYAPESVREKVHRIAHVGKLLGWQGDAATLIETMPAILGYGSNKLLTHARLFAEHGSGELTEKQVSRFVINALEAHIISLVHDKPYELRHIDAISKKHKGPERKAMVAEMLQKQPELLEAKVGKKVLRAYRRYAGL